MVALPIWGDPSLYDSSLRIAAQLHAAAPASVAASAARLPVVDGVTVTVIPGLMSPQVLAAAYGIPLNALGAPFLVTTGRRLRAEGWPAGIDTLVVMLDGDRAFAGLPPDGVTIWWGAYLGMESQILDHGPLAEAGPRIIAARAAHGWIMDIYLLQRDHSARGP